MNKKIKFKLWMIVTLAVFWLCPAVILAAEEPLCAALVIDISGSMTRSDPEGTALEAACLFLDMMDRPGSQAAVILFSDRIVTETEPAPLGEGSRQEMLKEVLREAKPDGDTDIGTAVLRAVELLKEEDSSTRKTVICFTDGKTDLPNADDPAEAEQISREKLEESAAIAKEEGISVSFVRLYTANQEGETEDDLPDDLSELEKISAGTGGQLYAASGKEMIPGIYTDLFAGLLGTGSEAVADVVTGDDGKASFDITVPPEGAVMADVVLLTSKPVEEAFVTDPDGIMTGVSYPEEPDPEDNALRETDLIRIIREETYTLIRLSGPSPGVWHFETIAERDCQIHVRMILEKEIILTASVHEDENGDALIGAALSRGETPLDEQTQKRYSVTAVVRDLSGKTGKNEEEYALYFNDGGFSTVIPVDPGGRIGVVLKADLEDIQKTSEEVIFTSTRSDDIIVNVLPEETVLTSFLPSGSEKTIDLVPFLNAWDGSKLEYSIKGDPPAGIGAAVMTQDQGTCLVLTGTGTGSGNVTVTASDSYGHEKEILFPVRSTVTLYVMIRPALLVFTAVLAFLLLIRVIKSKKPLNGRISLLLSSGSGGEKSLSASLEDCGRSITLAGLFPVLEQILPDLGKIRIEQGRDGIVLKNHGSASLYDCYGDPAGPLKLKDGDTFEIVCPAGGQIMKPLQISGVYDCAATYH